MHIQMENRKQQRHQDYFGVLLCCSTSEQRTWTNKELKSRSLMCWKADNSTAVSSKLWGSPRNTGNFPSVCALFLNFCWDQRLRKALIRGRAKSQVSYELGPPVCAMSPDPLRNCAAGFKRDSSADCEDLAKSLQSQYKMYISTEGSLSLWSSKCVELVNEVRVTSEKCSCFTTGLSSRTIYYPKEIIASYLWVWVSI